MKERMAFRRASVVVACAASASVCAAADVPRKVDVPPGDLASALRVLAQQSSAELVYPADQLKGIYTAGVHGEYTTEEAVNKLLDGTKLKIATHPSGAMLIAGPSANTSVSDVRPIFAKTIVFGAA